MLPALLLALSMGAYAQGADEATTGDEAAAPAAPKRFYHRVYVGFTGMDATAVNNAPNKDFRDFDKDFMLLGGEAGWAGGVRIARRAPLAVEFGGELAVGHGKDDYTRPFAKPGEPGQLSGRDVVTTKVTAFSFAIPVNITYKFNIGESGFAVAPYAGVHARFNLVCDLTSEVVSDNYELGTTEWSKYDKRSGSFFESEREGGSATNRLHTGARVQFGAQAGVNFYYKRYSLGGRYARNFTDFVDHCEELVKNPNSFSVHVGYTF